MSEVDAEKEKLCYAQNCEQARHLNDQLSRIPTVSITITGGLWFAAGVSQTTPNDIRFFLLVFSGICNLALILALFRVRDVFESYLEKIEAFYPLGFAGGKPSTPKLGGLSNYSMVTMFAVLMGLAAFSSFAGSFALYWPFSRTVPAGCGFLILMILLSAVFFFILIEKRGTA